MNTKKILFIICILANQFINSAKAQAPQSFNYQAVARDALGAVLSNQAVSFRISLLQGSAAGTSSYTETHAVTTNLLGLVNFAIGDGTVVSGNFATINWAQGPYFAQVELDAANNGTYVVMSTTQLLSVPYAQYAEKSGNPTLHAGSGIAIQNDSIINTAQNQAVNLSGTGQTNITGTYPNYVVNTPNIQAGNGISVNGQTVINSAPDQTVSMNGTGKTNVTGTYPNFAINTPPYLAGNGIGITGDTIKNISPDQIVTINGTGHTTVTGTYPNFTVNTPNYVGGTGINISGNNISAQNTNAIWNANKLQGKDIDTLIPKKGNVLQYDGSKWKPDGYGFTHYTGEIYGGGIVVSVWRDTNKVEHGLIAALTDIGSYGGNPGYFWSNVEPFNYVGYTDIGTSAQSPTDGFSNTMAIINQTGHTSSAAQLCRNYNGGGFTDWYLPAIWELMLCYNNSLVINTIIGITNGFFYDNWSSSRYWSSTEASSGQACMQCFVRDNNQSAYNIWGKGQNMRVRPVRKF